MLKMKFLNNLFKFYKLLKRDYPLVLLYSFVGSFSLAILPFVLFYFSAKIIDFLLVKDINNAYNYVYYFLIISFVLGLISYFCSILIRIISDDCYYTVWKQTAYKSFTLEYEKFERTETLDMINRAKTGSMYLGGISGQLVDLNKFLTSFISFIFSIAYIIKLFISSSYSLQFILFSIILVIAFLTFIIVSLFTQKSIAKLNNDMMKNNEHISSIMSYFLGESLDPLNGKDIRLANMQSLILHIYNKVFHESIDNFRVFSQKSSFGNGLLALLIQILSAIAYIYVGIGVIGGSISIGSILLFTGAIINLAIGMSGIFLEYNTIAYRFEYLNNFEDFIDSNNMYYDGSLPIEKRKDNDYVIEFQNVSFKYPNSEDYVLKNINFKFEVGGRFALVGPNGAGKSTLVKLLTRLYEPTSGKILLNGIDIWKYDYSEYTNIFSVVFQDFKLFSLPIGENIAGSCQYDEDKCWDVLDRVGIRHKIENWDNGLKTLLYKDCGDGIVVSGGEAQKIALARALYKNAPFIVLDEPTASLDPLAEAEVYEDFNQIIGNATALFISHRMSTCRFSSWIIVLENGEIVEQGRHKDLINQQGLYSEMWKAQSQYYV